MIEFWATALALAIFLYVILDGFDLGVGMLFPFAGSAEDRDRMLGSIAPVWDGNETWLVVAATVLFGAFPIVYSTLLSAFYIPLTLMLAGLILRGVAFEFRYKAGALRWVWDAGFVVGSYAASFVQGAAVGAIVQGLPVMNGRYVGGPFAWVGTFPILCGVALCVGYALAGASWVAGKTAGTLQDFALRAVPLLLFTLLAFLCALFVFAVRLNLALLDRWTERPAMLAFPVIGAVASAGIVWAILRRRDWLLFPCSAMIFVAAFATLAASFLPYMIPDSITIEQAAAPEASLSFMFWGAGVFVLPLTLAYTAVVYFIFRGKTPAEVEPN
jgi:cytochrome d ubiquinol oxidase subunit II